MLQDPTRGAAASTVHPAAAPTRQYETLRYLLFGSLSAVQATIKLLHKLDYAEPNDWSNPSQPGDPMK